MLTILMLLVLLLVFIFGNFVYSYWKDKQLLKLMERIPGPPCQSIFGNLLNFPKSKEEFWARMRSYSKQYYPIYRLWGSYTVSVNLLCPEDIEIILSNTKHIEKSPIYRCLEPWLGTGLLISSGVKWHYRRKLLTPAFHFNILQQFVEVFDEQGEVLVNRLKTECNKPFTIVGPLITRTTLNIVCETAMGTRLDYTSKKQTDYVKALYRLGELIIYRISRPWLSYDTVYRLTSSCREANELIKNTLHAFSMSIIKERQEKFSPSQTSFGNCNSQKRLAMLDLLISAKNNGSAIDDNGIREEVDTFIFGGYDTTAANISFTLMLLACNKDVQDNIVQELNDVLGDAHRRLTYTDLQNMRYLELVLKESLRMYPSVPYIARLAGEEIKTHTGYTIPAGCYINIHIYDLHHNPEIYPDPYTFDPERFLPEYTQKRHPYAYLPFSAGPRNCIGQKFAVLQMKSIISAILRRYVLEPVDKPSDITLYTDVVLRSSNGVKVKFRPRPK